VLHARATQMYTSKAGDNYAVMEISWSWQPQT
jgi:hypothetical protein